MKEVFIIKNLENNLYYHRIGTNITSWTNNIEIISEFDTYGEAKGVIESKLLEGRYSIEKIFIKWD